MKNSDIYKWKQIVENLNNRITENDEDVNHTDHEVSMAKSQMLSSMKSINRIAKHLSTKSESEGLEGWTASKLTMAEDYLQAVADYFDGQEINEGYKVMPPMDPKYVARKGLEGPFSTLSGKVVYYDPKEGKYYDPDTDMYMSYDEFRRYDDDYKGMKDERDEVKEGDDTVKVVFRKFDNGDVIALFPEEEQGRGLITSYMEIGQHSDASKSLITDLEPASKEEYAELAAELKRIGYDIVIAESVNEAKLSSEQREELDDLIDMVKYGTSPSTYDDASDVAMQALKTIRSKFGDKVADHVEDGIHDFHFPRHGMAPGTYGTDRLASKKPTAIKKDGKIDSRSAKSTKRDIKSNLRGMGKKDPKRLGESQALTEAEFDEAAGEKDACYHKVKSRYKVWPSAYASGALVKCRKVGAKNWGNSKKD